MENKCGVCGKENAEYTSYDKKLCSIECFREAGKTYDHSKATGSPVHTRNYGR